MLYCHFEVKNINISPFCFHSDFLLCSLIYLLQVEGDSNSTDWYHKRALFVSGGEELKKLAVSAGNRPCFYGRLIVHFV